MAAPGKRAGMLAKRKARVTVKIMELLLRKTERKEPIE